MSTIRVGSIDSVNGNNALAIAADGSVTRGSYAMSTGMVKLADAEWSTDTDGVNFDVFDSTKYINYKIYWWVCHDSTAGDSTTTSWFQTGMCFRNASGNLDSSNAYDNNCSWVSSGSTDPDTNNSIGAGEKNRIWMCGNGYAYDSQGEALISIPPHSDFRACVVGQSQLIGAPRVGGASTNYLEEFASVMIAGSTDPTQLTGFRFCSFRGTTGNYSKRGYISVYGIER